MEVVNTCFKSVDSVLGPGNERFFGMGFRKAQQIITNVEIYPRIKEDNNQGKINAKASLFYPNDWSKKEGTKVLKPHLTSIDAVVFAVQLNEMFLTYKYKLTEEQRKEIWIKSVTMKAGTSPNEDLKGFDIESIQLSTDNFRNKDQFISVFEAKIGNIRIKSEIIHRQNGIRLDNKSYETCDTLLGSADKRYYGEGYKVPKQIIKDVEITHNSVSSMVTIEKPKNIDLITNGAEGKYRPSISMIDCMLIIAQLGQVLIYHLDNITREKSNTLWMRKVYLESNDPYQLGDNFKASTHIVKSKLFSIKNNFWRSCDMVGNCKGIKVEYSIAHELPNDLL